MKPELIGERVRIAAKTPGILLPLVVSAITAFAEAAGGDPDEHEELEAADRESLARHSEAGDTRLRLTIGDAGIVVSLDEDAAEAVLTWPA